MSEPTHHPAFTEKMPLPSEGPQLPPQMIFMQMVTGYWVSQAIYVAAKLSIADLLADGPLTADQIAGTTGSHAPTLYRLLRALASLGVFAEDEDARFSLAPLGAVLREGPGSIRSMVLHLCEGPSWQAWGEMYNSVQTGETSFVLAHGREVFPYYAEHPTSSAPFNQAMTEFSDTVSAAVTEVYDFSQAKKIVDVGGGHGGLLAAILGANPAAQGIVFDLPEVVAGAWDRLQAEGLTDRCELVGGDFFAAAPVGGDVYVLKSIIHDWDDARALAILKNVRAAINEGGRLLLVETVIPPADSGQEAVLPKFADLHMLAMTGGRERTAEEFAALLSEAGFTMTSIIPTPVIAIVEAITEPV